ncbi:cytochrome P450 1A1-like [Antedon mediterranea]|uniref:cytochrome P450 1A1-like n=1 Tax=Antedon mediterranea TaxID=105859 RepID=UPI003AF7150D
MISTLVVYFLSAAFIYITLYYISELRDFYILRMPPGPLSLPFIGNLLNLDHKFMHLSLGELAKRHGKIFTIKFGSDRVVILNDTAQVKQAYNGPHLTSRPKVFSIDFFLNKCFMTCSDKQEFRTHTRLMKNTFRVISDTNLNTKITEEAEDLIRHFESYENKPFNPRKDCHLASLNILYNLAFGQRYHRDDSELEEILSYSSDIIKGISPAHPVNLLPWLQKIPNKWLNALSKARDRRDCLLMKKYYEHDATYKEGVIRDMLDVLLKEARNAKAQGDENVLRLLTPEHIVINIWTIFFAGMDTVLTALLWLLLYMAAFPEVQSKIQKQMDEVLGDTKPTIMDEKKLPLLCATVYETLRYSSLSLLGVPHSATQDTTIGGYYIPKDTQVMANFWTINHDKTVWNEPNKFSPERFLDTDGDMRNLNDFPHFMPFSTGRRACLGKNIGKSEIFLLAAFILQRFHIKLPQNAEPVLDADVHFDLVPKAFELVVSKR